MRINMLFLYEVQEIDLDLIFLRFRYSLVFCYYQGNY